MNRIRSYPNICINQFFYRFTKKLYKKRALNIKRSEYFSVSQIIDILCIGNHVNFLTFE